MKCRTKFCRGRTFPTGRSPYCSKCRARRWKANHPVSYAFAKLKFRAKERGHTFTLTLADFTALWNAGLGENRGRNGHCHSIDRIDPIKGYEPGNVQILTVSENVRRRYAVCPYNEQEMAETSRQIAEAYAGQL